MSRPEYTPKPGTTWEQQLVRTEDEVTATWNDASPEAQELASEYYEIDLAEMLVAAQAATTRVRELHVARPNGTCAARCYSEGMAPEPWPCPTIRALDTPAKDNP